MAKYDQTENAKYKAPSAIFEKSASELLEGTSRAVPKSLISQSDSEPKLFVSGDIELLKRNCVSIIGSRDATDQGKAIARQLAHELSDAGIVVMSGLAEGIDTEAMESAIGNNGHIVGVIGTPLNKAYPAKNKQLQELIYQNHLLVSQFPEGERVFQSNFPKRNRLMALLSDATVVIEATDSSGTCNGPVNTVFLLVH